MKSRFLSALCASVLSLASVSADAAILKFYISGVSVGDGPLLYLHGSFLFDTSTPLSELVSSPPIDGISYIQRFQVMGGVSDFYAQIEGVSGVVWSLDSPVASAIGADVFITVAGSETFMSFQDAMGGEIRIYFSDGKPGPDWVITTQEWMESPDPVAKFFLDSNSLGSNVAAAGDYEIGSKHVLCTHLRPEVETGVVL